MSFQPMSLIDKPGITNLLKVAEMAPIGDFVEIGVFKGGSAWYLNKLCIQRNCKLHLFDTFEGMPEPSEIDVHKKGEFGNVDFGNMYEIFPNANIYKGIFPKTLPENLFNIAFVHADCDLNSSMEAIVELIPERMVKNGIIYFDDYQLPGVKLAVDRLSNIHKIPGNRAVWRKE